MSNRESFIKKIKDEGLEAGLAFDVATNISNIPKETDVVLLMGRKAGFGHLEFEKNVLTRIKKVKEMGFKVGVDGGIDIKNIELIRNAGADIVYSEVNYWDLKEKNDGIYN
jgi:pentose-5-phosphate-3-epimerase